MRIPSVNALLHYLIPPVVAAALVVVYFAIFDRWTAFHDPINSIVAPILGVVGFVVGAAFDYAQAARARKRAGSR